MKLMGKIIFFTFLFCIVICSCVSKKTTYYDIDYEKEHMPKQEFDFNSREAFDLCYKGWFLVNELTDPIFMAKQTFKMSNEESDILYNDKIQNALDAFEQSNKIEINPWNYRGIAEIYKVKMRRFSYNEIENYPYLVTMNYFEAYKIKQDKNIYSELIDSISSLSSDDKLIIYDTLISISQNQFEIADFHYNKGNVYKKRNDNTKAFIEYKTAFEVSDNYESSEKYFSKLINTSDEDKKSSLQTFLDNLLKNEKDNNKIAFLQYEKGILYQHSDNYEKAYNQYIVAKKNVTDKSLLQTIDSQILKLQENYKKTYKNTFKKLIIAKKAGFNSYDDYQAFLQRVDFEQLCRSLNLGKDTFYVPGDIIIAPAQRLSIIDVEQVDDGYIYLVTAYGLNQFSKCCVIFSDHQIQYVLYNGEGLITEKLFLDYQGKTTYKSGYSIVDCDIFTAITPFFPELKELSYRMNEAVKYEKWDFDYSLRQLTGEEYELLIKNNYYVALYPEGYYKLYRACTSEITDTLNKNEKPYNNWKKVFDSVLASSFEITQDDYGWLCETFNESDEFNSYLEQYIDKTNFYSKLFEDAYVTCPKNFNTYITHIKDVSDKTVDFFNFFVQYDVQDEKIIKSLINKGLNISKINAFNCSEIFLYLGNLSPHILQIYIDNGLDINMRIPIIENYTLLKALQYVYDDEEEWGHEHSVRKDVIDCLIKNGAKK